MFHPRKLFAIDEHKDSYDTAFHNPNENKMVDLSALSSIHELMQKFNWEHRIDEHFIFDSEIEEETDQKHLAYLKRMKRKAQRFYELDSTFNDGIIDNTYGIKIGDVWLGSL